MRTLNLGILAHVDAGKTTLTERLLYAAGVIDEIGSVDDGSTQTDTLDLERQRGITIKSAVVSFAIGDITVNLIDTPGHPDFIAEVERALNVLDGAVLVISAVEGVQAQTRILMRTLQRLRIPTLMFVNKIDRAGARSEGVLRDIAEKLTPAIISMGLAGDLGTRSPSFSPYGETDAAFTSRLADVLLDQDEALSGANLEGRGTISYERLRAELAARTGRALVHPVFFGSAMTGTGVDSLMAGIAELLPAAEGDVDGPVSGTVFKVERGRAGEKIAYVRLFSGRLHTRDRLPFGTKKEAKVTAIRVFERGSSVAGASVSAGQIAKLWGLGEIQIGDGVGISRTSPEAHYFAPPTLETVVLPRRPSDGGALRVALDQLAEQDPLINVRQDDSRQELSVSLYGEVQKEVIGATLANDFKVEVDFRETTTICIERPAGIGAALEVLGKGPNPFLATVGLRIEPAGINGGVEFRVGRPVLGTMPLAFFKAVEESVLEMLQQGVYGWQVADCTVTMTHTGFDSVNSTAGDFRHLAPLVLASALRRAGTRVYEPLHRFSLEIPADLFGAVAPLLTRCEAVPQTQELRASTYVLEGGIPAARVHQLQQELPALTRGEGVLESAFDSYQPIRGPIPTRPRTDNNPLNRKEYMLHVVRRV